MWVIGLTGGIGSGKSTVADLFARLGVPVIDTDLIARQLTEPGSEALAEIHVAFPDIVPDPAVRLDRARLRDLVFSDVVARQKLEAILHPRIGLEVRNSLARVQAPYAMVVIPLLVETGGYRDVLDRILVVDCPEAQQIERVMTRNGLSQAAVERIMAIQASRADRLAVADDVILNSDTPEALQVTVVDQHQRYLNFSKTAPP